MKIQSKGFFNELVKLALPVSIQALLVSILNVTDVMMVGALGDSSAVAAVGLANKMHFVTLLLIFGFTNAASVLISQYVGAQQFHKIKQVISLSILTGGSILLPVVLLFSLSPENWLSFISDDPAVIRLSADYLVITATVVIIMVIIMSYEVALRALGQTTAPMLFAAASIAINVCLNYILIFGKMGFPAMGVAGAAWATLVSRIIQLALMYAYLIVTNHQLKFSKQDFKGLIDQSSWLSFWAFSLPIAFNFVLWGFGSSIYHMIASRMGTIPLAVISILAPIESLVISLFMGFSAAASILLGRALGANDFDYAWQLKTFFIRYAVLFAAVVGLIMWLAQPIILIPFGQLEEETTKALQQAYLVFCALVWIKVHNMMTMVSVLRAGGDTFFCIKIDILCMWIIGIPLSAYAGLKLELAFIYVYLIMYSEEIVKLALSHWRMYQRKWLRNLTGVIKSKPT